MKFMKMSKNKEKILKIYFNIFGNFGNFQQSLPYPIFFILKNNEFELIFSYYIFSLIT